MKYNVIIACNVIEHIYEPAGFVRSLRERLTPGGRIVLATPDIGSFWYRLLKRRWPSFKIPEHVVFYSDKTLGRLLREGSFKSIRPIPFAHAFPFGLIADKIGFRAPEAIGHVPVWIPGTMTALAGERD
jgi:SAM-dependent methyltransferase